MFERIINGVTTSVLPLLCISFSFLVYIHLPLVQLTYHFFFVLFVPHKKNTEPGAVPLITSFILNIKDNTPRNKTAHSIFSLVGVHTAYCTVSIAFVASLLRALFCALDCFVIDCVVRVSFAE
jgi:hypothetical protein